MNGMSASESETGSFAHVDVNPGRVLRAIARIGYTPQSAICDIVTGLDGLAGTERWRAARVPVDPGASLLLEG